MDTALPDPTLSGIEHVVVVMMENRSFDHLLGWLPNANGRQAGLTYLDSNGNPHATQRLSYYVGCDHPDPDHSYSGGRSEYAAGEMDGWLRTGSNAGVSCRYYFSNVPFLALWGLKYAGISALYEQFKADAADGSLPAVSFVDPSFTILDDGTGNDDHPHADLRKGEIFLRNVVTTLASGPRWSNTVLVINRDEWGGFFDHVVPPRVIAPNAVDTDLVDGKALLGCRVPTLIVSPFARGNPKSPRINSLLYDHTSVLKLIEWRWGLSPLTARDASQEVANLAHALNFAAQDPSMPALPVVAEPALDPCTLADIFRALDTGEKVIDSQRALQVARQKQTLGEDNESYDFYLLMKSERMQGWPVRHNLKEK